MSSPLVPARRPERLDDVVAVLVVHDGARWLPEVLTALRALTARPRAVVAVDTGSTDGSADLLRAAVDDGLLACVLDQPRSTGYGAAVAAGVEQLDRDGPAADWLWLLHDDAAPAPDCLAVLREHAEASPSTALVGPKALDWDDPRVLVEVGVTTDRAGHRETGLERRERDQGQHDAPRDVLAVGTAGALVRRAVWDAVGGLAPELPLYRDELDLGWRITAAGSRVVVVPSAVVRHARASTTGRRSPGAVAGDPLAVDRRHALLVLLSHASTARLVVGVPALLLMQVLRVLGHLLTRSVTGARAEALAPVDVLGRPVRLRRMRRTRARTRTAGTAAVGPLLASRAGRLRARAESSAALLAGSSAPAHARGGGLGDPDAPDGAPDRPRLLRSLLQRPGVALVLALALVAVVAERAVLSTGGGLLQGGRLLPPPDGAADLWSAYAATWSSTGPGTPAPAAPRTAVLAALSSVLLGKPWLAVDLLLLASVPLAGLTAWLVARRLVASRLLQVWAGATWALLPVATGAVAAGRLDAAAVQVALPLLGLAAVVVLRDDPRGAWHRAWGLGLALAVVTALAPTLWLVAAPLLLGAGAAAVAGAAPAQRAPARRRAAAAALVVAVPVVLLLPWSLQVVRTPGLLVHGPGRLAADPALADADLPAWHLLGLSPGGAGLPPAWVGVGLLLAALAALVRRDRTDAVLRAWTAALAGLLLALLLARARSDAPVGPESLPVWPGVPLQVAGAGLLVAALLGADGLRDRLARSAFGARQVGAALLAVAAGLVPLVAAASWVLRGADGPLDRQAPPSVPAFAEAELDADPGLRLLRLSPGDDRVSYELVTGAGARLGTADLPAEAGQRQALDALVADLLTPSGSDAAAGLAARGVRYVALPRAAAGTPLAAALDTQASLARRADDPVLLWEVLVPTSRLVVLDPDAADAATEGSARGPRDASSVTALDDGQTARVAGGPAGRLLVLAEAADRGWRAELDGEPLEPVTAWSGVQGFELPRDGGTVVVGRDDERTAVLALQATGLVIVAVLAAPGATRRRGLEPVDAGRADDAPTRRAA